MKIVKHIFLTILFLLFLIFYLLLLKGQPGTPKGNVLTQGLGDATKPFELSPERGRYLLTYSLARDKSFSLKYDLAEGAMPDVGYYQGKFYVFFTPGVSLLATPLFMLGSKYDMGQLGAFLTVVIFAFMNLMLVYVIGRTMFRLPLWAALTSVLIFGFASTSLSYAVTLYQHHISTFLILSSLFAAWRYRNKRGPSFLNASYVWLAYGIGMWVDYPNIVLMMPVMLYFAYSTFSAEHSKNGYALNIRLSGIFTSVILFGLVFLHLYFNKVNFGSPFKTSGGIASYKTIQELQLFKKANAKQNIANATAAKSEISFFKEEYLIRGLSVLLIGLDRSIILYSPIFLLALFGCYYLVVAYSTEGALFISLIAVNLLLYSSWGDPWGGWAFGPRYLIPSMPILSLSIGIWLARNPNIAKKIAAFLLIIPSIAIAFLGALTTSQVPPIPEAIPLHMKYNFLLNVDYVLDNRSSSYLFNAFFRNNGISLMSFFFLLAGSVLLIQFTLLFIIPSFTQKYENSH